MNFWHSLTDFLTKEVVQSKLNVLQMDFIFNLTKCIFLASQYQRALTARFHEAMRLRSTFQSQSYLQWVPLNEVPLDDRHEEFGQTQADVGFRVGVALLSLPVLEPRLDQVYIIEVVNDIVEQGVY